MAVSAEYSSFVVRVWDRIETLTGHTPFYVDATHICSYCPRCNDGTLMIAFGTRPRPRAFISSQGGGDGACSRGCRAIDIMGALFDG